MKNTVFIMIFIFVLSASAQEQVHLTPDDIVAKMDQNMTFHTLYTETEMIITMGSRIIKKTFISFSQGTEKSFIEFLSPLRDKGTKILKIGKVLKIYFPSAGQVKRLSQHMLQQSLMGSDFSYEDMTERSRELKEEYTIRLLEDDEFNGIPCFVLYLESKTPQKNYYTQKVWVDKDKFIGRKVEFYARSGRLLKILTVDEIRPFNNHFYPVKLTMQDKLRTNTKTEIILMKVKFDESFPDETFTERNLMRR